MRKFVSINQLTIVIGVVTARLQQVDPSDCRWVTGTSVEAFADLAIKFKIPSAENVSKLFAKGISQSICLNEKGILGTLSKALVLEESVFEKLPRNVNKEALRKYNAGLSELKKSLETGKIKAALKAQGMISEAVKELLIL